LSVAASARARSRAAAVFGFALVARTASPGFRVARVTRVQNAILGARFTVSPVSILLAISYFSWIWGVLGALLSVPILLIMEALLENLGRPNLIGFLLGEPLFRGTDPNSPDPGLANPGLAGATDQPDTAMVHPAAG
jgi:hypothetical protein